MNPEKKIFVNLHTHSYYSILSASQSPEKICEKAKKLNCPAVALTDTANGHGMIEFYEIAKKEKIKPILGAEIFFSKDSRFEKRVGIDGKEGYLVLLAKNETGYQNLLKILSIGSLEGFYYKPRIDLEILEKYKEGLFCLTGSTGGLIGKTLQNFGKPKTQEIFQKINNIFGVNNFFIELTARVSQEQQDLNIFNLSLAKEYGNEILVTSDARYAELEDEEAADTLFCIGKNMQVGDEYRKRFAEKNWFKSWEEMCLDLDYIKPEILEKARRKSLEISEKINLEIKFGQNLLPLFEVEKEETVTTQLRKNCEKNIESRYKVNFEKDPNFENIVKERLDYELSIIEKMGFEAYFLICQDFVQFAKNNNIAVGPGRGSAAGSIVSYLLEITNIDPLEYGLLFERFLNPERVSMPDIDIDFSDERRDEVLQYVIEKYGTEKVSKVCTFGTMAAKAAIKDVGRANGIPFAEMNAMTKLLPNKPGFSLDDAENIPDFKTLVDSKPKLKKVFGVAKKLEGCIRHVSVHACAVIIGKYNLKENVPLQWAPGAEEIKITQFPYEQLDRLGLLKMDFLGLKNLSIIEKTIQNIEQSTGEKIDLNNIDLQDKKTFELFSKGDTTGVFQFESSGMRKYLKELQPTEFENLVAMNALYRPGPMESIPEYIKNKNNPEKIIYKVLELKPFLESTYGIIVYQEQVQRVVQEFAGFSLGAGYLLIKAVGKKIPKLLMEQKEKFMEGAQKKGYSKKLAKQIFSLIEPFAGYGFNKSHSTCYARIAYETAYLKANYPVEFMAAMMTTDRGNTDRIVLEMGECNNMNIEVLPPSINESGSFFTVVEEKNVDNSQKSII